MKTIIRFGLILFTLLATISANGQELSTGSVVGRHIYGLARDVNGDPLLLNETPLIYDSTGFEQRLPVGDKLFIVSGLGDTLGGLYLTQYDVKTRRYIDTLSFDLTQVDGLTRPRGGIKTPWNSVLLGESEIIDSAIPQTFVDQYKYFYKGQADLVNAYHYGWPTEAIILDEDGASKIIKDYAVGRVFASEIYLMPDGKTLYLFDGDNTGLLYLFVADKINSLSSGTLYSVSIDSGKAVYKFLGHSSALRMKLKMKKIEFDKLFDKAPVENNSCADKFIYVNTIFGEECLKTNTKNKRYAGLFEPVRMTAIQRVGQPLTVFSEVELMPENKQITLTIKNGSKRNYRLGQNTGMGSNYVIQESEL